MKDFLEMAETLELIAAGLRSMSDAMGGIPGGFDDRKLCDCDGYDQLSCMARRSVSGAQGYNPRAILTMGDLVAMTDDQLMDRKRIGYTVLSQLKQFMATAGKDKP